MEGALGCEARRPAGDSLANSLALAKDGAEHLSPDTGKASDKDIL